ncbi:MAG: hypothetical protein RLO17_02790 [Cyclobacteriaceae bacterium]
MKPLSIIILIVFVVCSCDDDTFVITSRDYPRLITKPVTTVTSRGARFNAEFRYRGDKEITSYGFVWNETPFPTLRTPSTEIYMVNENIQDDRYSTFISSGLIANETYYVRTFIQTSYYTVYGINQEFVSKGSEN